MSITYSQARAIHRDQDVKFPATYTNSNVRPPAANAAQLSAVVIEPRQFIRDCLVQALRSVYGQDVLALSSIDEWLDICERSSASVLLLSGFDQVSGEGLAHTIKRLSQARKRIPAVILSDAEDFSEVMNALNSGVRGYIPTNLPLDVAVEAMRLVKAGGVFVPAGCLRAGEETSKPPKTRNPLSDLFTSRQTAVVEALRQGKANKTIAYELNLQESTVKVHIRNIMKKLKAKNRTEVAYIVNNLQKQSGI
ncbi:MAG: response regulator transcription factor [Rhodomicrobium sp.]|nr:response regulator transcription factor [Rhodomicrobium sp.]